MHRVRKQKKKEENEGKKSNITEFEEIDKMINKERNRINFKGHNFWVPWSLTSQIFKRDHSLHRHPRASDLHSSNYSIHRKYLSDQGIYIKYPNLCSYGSRCYSINSTVNGRKNYRGETWICQRGFHPNWHYRIIEESINGAKENRLRRESLDKDISVTRDEIGYFKDKLSRIDY